MTLHDAAVAGRAQNALRIAGESRGEKPNANREKSYLEGWRNLPARTRPWAKKSPP
jgi:hypothetical protein